MWAPFRLADSRAEFAVSHLNLHADAFVYAHGGAIRLVNPQRASLGTMVRSQVFVAGYDDLPAQPTPLEPGIDADTVNFAIAVRMKLRPTEGCIDAIYLMEQDTIRIEPWYAGIDLNTIIMLDGKSIAEISASVGQTKFSKSLKPDAAITQSELIIQDIANNKKLADAAFSKGPELSEEFNKMIERNTGFEIGRAHV